MRRRSGGVAGVGCGGCSCCSCLYKTYQTPSVLGGSCVVGGCSSDVVVVNAAWEWWCCWC